jgi:hypothetical protein
VARVVGVHGIGHDYDTSETLTERWAPALAGGVGLAGGSLSKADIFVAAYGDIFRPRARRVLGVGNDAPLDQEELEGVDDFERELLAAWWRAAAESDTGVVSPDARTLGTPEFVQRALLALSNSRFFANVTSRALRGNLRQVRDYLHNDTIRRRVRQRVADAIGSDTRVLVGHSLGSVVAYEALFAKPDCPVTTFVTLGSPLGIPNLIFDALDPKPKPKGCDGVRGHWPPSVTAWTNFADEGDVVALEKDLRPMFGPRVANWLITNGATEHDIKPYLTAKQTGAAIAAGLEQ